MQSNLNIKISKKEREKYNLLCKNEDTTMSQDIRKFIRSRIEELEKKNKEKK
jgi:hypothetical protein